MDDATSMEMADMTPVMEKMDPNFPSVSPNFCLKKNVTHDLIRKREHVSQIRPLI